MSKEYRDYDLLLDWEGDCSVFLDGRKAPTYTPDGVELSVSRTDQEIREPILNGESFYLPREFLE